MKAHILGILQWTSLTCWHLQLLRRIRKVKRVNLSSFSHISFPWVFTSFLFFCSFIWRQAPASMDRLVDIITHRTKIVGHQFYWTTLGYLCVRWLFDFLILFLSFSFIAGGGGLNCFKILSLCLWKSISSRLKFKSCNFSGWKAMSLLYANWYV